MRSKAKLPFEECADQADRSAASRGVPLLSRAAGAELRVAAVPGKQLASFRYIEAYARRRPVARTRARIFSPPEHAGTGAVRLITRSGYNSIDRPWIVEAYVQGRAHQRFDLE